MNFPKKNLLKILPIISSVFLFDGCMPRQADGSYPTTYSYHPYNKIYKTKKDYKPKRVYHTSVQPKKIYKPKRVYRSKKSVQKPKRYQPQAKKSYRPVSNPKQYRDNRYLPFPPTSFSPKKPVQKMKSVPVPRMEKPHNQTKWVPKQSIQEIERLAVSQMGKRYKWGANGPYTFDCSGFTKFVYSKKGITLPRVSKDQAKVGKLVGFKQLKKGDLLFFDSSKSSKVSHTGIYLGDSKFIHASSRNKKVVISSIGSNYYSRHFKWGRRIIR